MLRRSKSRRLRLAAALLTGLGTAMIVPASAPAAFHLMKVAEVYPGTTLCPDCSFVELQMYAAGQNFVSGHTVRVYSASGAVVPFATATFPSNVPNGESQRTILVGDSSVVGRDFNGNFGTGIDAAGGAVCFDTIDCVAWGTVNTGALPAGANVGPPAPAIPDGSALVRSIAPGCATLLEGSDDTENSAADFSLSTAPSPRANSVTPTETPCGGGGGAAPQTEIDKGPKKKIKKKTAKFKFSSSDPAATFECRLDEKPFKACTSPFKVKRIKPGKHVFSVRAVVGGTPDPSPAKYRFKRKRR